MRLLGTLFDVEELLFLLFLFLGLFCLFLWLLAKGRIRELLGGFLRLLLSFFYCPYVYLKKTVHVVADFGKKREEELARSHHYLGTRITMLMRVALIVTVVGVFAFFVVSGWEAMLPPKFYRIAAKNAETQLEQQQAQQATVSAHVSQLEQDWTNRRDSLIADYKNSKKKQIDDLASANAELETKVSTTPEGARVFSGLKRYLDSGNANLASAQQYLQMFVVSEDARDDLGKYVANWNTARILRRQLDNMSQDSLRRAIQPDYESSRQNSQYWSNQISSTAATLAHIGGQMRYSPESLFVSLLVGSFICLLIIWGVGLFLEAYGEVTNVMDDIQRIRELTEVSVERSLAATGGQK